MGEVMPNVIIQAAKINIIVRYTYTCNIAKIIT